MSADANAPSDSSGRRRALRLLAGVAAVLALSAALVGTAAPPSRGAHVDVGALARTIEREEDHVTALELAAWIRDRKPGLRVLDLRSDSAFAAYHVPSAARLPLAALDTLRPRSGETLVLYSDGGIHAAQAWVLLRAAGFDRVYSLRGGLLDWASDVMNPVLGADTSAAGRAADARTAALSRYFGGVPRGGPPSPSPSSEIGAAASSSRLASPAAAASDAIARTVRRGC